MDSEEVNAVTSLENLYFLHLFLDTTQQLFLVFVRISNEPNASCLLHFLYGVRSVSITL